MGDAADWVMDDTPDPDERAYREGYEAGLRAGPKRAFERGIAEGRAAERAEIVAWLLQTLDSPFVQAGFAGPNEFAERIRAGAHTQVREGDE